MLKQCQVVMLTTNQKTQLFIPKNGKNLHLSKGIHKDYCNYQYLYITSSNEEIKEGDWKYCSKTNYITQYKETKDSVVNERECCKKIIATTDKSLIYNPIGSRFNIPQIPESFIKAFVESNGTIKEVLVRYNQFDSKEIIINPDNTINISLIEDYKVLYEQSLEKIGKMMLETYTKDEVKSKLEDLVRAINLHNEKDKPCNFILQDWIENNL